MSGLRVGVYDQYWPTAGGGEKVAAAVASVLGRQHQVTLLGHDVLDLDGLGERLQLDLSGLDVRVLDLTPTCVEEAGVDYDLVVNASYMSSAACTARHGLYYVHFPHPPMRDAGGLKGLAVRRLRPLLRIPGLEVAEETGLHPDEAVGRWRIRWTTGEAEVVLRVPPGEEVPFQVDLLRMVPAAEPVPVQILVDGHEQASVILESRSSRTQWPLVSVTVTLTGPADGRLVKVGIRSPSMVPAARGDSDDMRRLGVPMAGIRLGTGVRARLVRAHPSLAQRRSSLAWVASYDRVLANSDYTRTWVDRWWGVEPDVLHPPVTMQDSGGELSAAAPGSATGAGSAKDAVILNVGRFFDAERGHSKKQLELVRTFREMVDGGLAGWELHLVGGCGRSDRAYLERVRHAVQGAPVTLHVDATGAELRDLYRRASIYWHASGLGEDPDRHPDRFEHFGITTVEAMSAGAVPIVLGEAGQREVVEHGRSGYHFHDLGQLVALTRTVVDDPDLRANLARAARVRAQQYSLEAFAGELESLVESLG